MFNKEKLESELDNHEQLTYTELIHATGAGAGGGILAGALELSNLARNDVTELSVRLLTGAADGVTEGIFTLVKEVPKHLRGHANKGGRTVYYAYGKLAGALLSWVPDFSIRYLANGDPYSPFPGAFGSVSIAELDMGGGSFGIAVYDVKKYGFREGAKRYFRDPVAVSSLIIYSIYVVGNTLSRHFGLIYEDNFLYHWLETLPPALSCLIPPSLGLLQERRLKRK